MTGKVDSVCPYSAPNLQNSLSTPAFKIGKAWNMRLNKIFASLDFLEVLPGTYRFGRVTYVARTPIPITSNLVDWYVSKVHVIPSGYKF
jgi:hypothetical protein